MKPRLIAGTIIAALLLFLIFLWARRGANTSTSEFSDETNLQVAVPAVSIRESAARLESLAQPQKDEMPAGIPEAELERIRREQAAIERLNNQDHNVPVAFYGLVVDQHTNPLPNVTADLAVVEEIPQPHPQAPTHKMTRLKRETGPDGRFEVTGLRGTSVEVYSVTKEGYEHEEPNMTYGGYGAQTTSFINPAVLRMWSTNLHEPLVSGERSFVIIPDGRHYAIDLLKGTITEGNDGDLVGWIKRPEKVKWGERYDWSCELTVPTGGLLEFQTRAMFMAPEAGYTNSFAYKEDANLDGGGPMTGDKRFYVKLHDGRMYARIVIAFYADYYGKKPAMIQVSYAVNPSGSRLLR